MKTAIFLFLLAGLVLAGYTPIAAQANCYLQAYALPVADHTWSPDPRNPTALNLMMHVKFCNPEGCPPKQFMGLQITASGSGDDAADIARVSLFLDMNCDGVPDGPEFACGQYPSDNGTLQLCGKTGGPTIEPGQCFCVLVYYDMNECVQVGRDYLFTLNTALTSNCQPWPTLPNSLLSAKKTIDDCCLIIDKAASSPADHTWTPSPGKDQWNTMLVLKLIDACCQDAYILQCLQLQILEGNPTDVDSVLVWDDQDCDGIFDAGESSWPFPSPYGPDAKAAICMGAFPPITYGSNRCVGIAYKLKDTVACDSTHKFAVTSVQAIRASGSTPCVISSFPINSARKTVYCPPCCLEVNPGPNNPPDHYWTPVENPVNAMLQIQVLNQCPNTRILKCLRLHPAGSGNTAADTEKVQVYVDLNCNGKVDPAEPLFGEGSFSADNSSVLICGNYNIPPSSTLCLLAAYVMKPTSIPGSTYQASLEELTAINADGTSACVNINSPLGDGTIRGGTKTRCWLISEAKCAPVGTQLCLTGKVQTARFPDRFYIEEKDRSSGIGVTASGTLLPAVGTLEIDVWGYTYLSGCELLIAPSSFIAHDKYPLFPLGMNNRAVGGTSFCNQPAVDFRCCSDRVPGFGLNNVGELVRVWGRVTYVRSPFFWIDDGTHRTDGEIDPKTGECVLGLRVDSSQAIMVPQGSYAIVTGISRVTSNQAGCCIPVIYPRNQTDVWTISEEK